MAVGDTVFLWRSQGKDRGEQRSGVVASAEIISSAALMKEEPESRPFWLDTSKLGAEQPRVWLKITRTANRKEELKRAWLADDECLKNMLILKQPSATNFRLTPEEAVRLHKMWSRVGQDWNRNESIAGLWAYVETYGKEVSKSSSSPVGKVSKLTGRAINGVYNKVMNYRSLDPRDSRAGMSGAGKTDHAVWAEFFDTAKMLLDEDAVRSEFERLWGQSSDGGANAAVDQAVEDEVFSREVDKLLVPGVNYFGRSTSIILAGGSEA